MSKLRYILVLSAILFVFNIHAQTKADTLKGMLSMAHADTEKVNILNRIADYYRVEDSAQQALVYANRAMHLAKTGSDMGKLAESELQLGLIFAVVHKPDSMDILLRNAESILMKADNKKALIRLYKGMGGAYRSIVKYTDAIMSYGKGIELAKQLHDSASLYTFYNNTGNVYEFYGAYDRAVEFYSQAISIALATKQYMKAINAYNFEGSVYAKEGLSATATKVYFDALKLNADHVKNDMVTAVLTVNIGNIYHERFDTVNAMKYYNEALKIFTKRDDKKYISILFGNIGNVYMDEKDLKRAEEYELKSLHELEATGDMEYLGRCYTNMGEFYRKSKQYDKALKYYNMSLQYHTSVKDSEAMEYCIEGLSDLYADMGNYDKAEEYGLQALNISKHIGLLPQIRDVSKDLSDLFDKIHKPDKAFSYYKMYIDARDSLENKEEAKKLMRNELDYEYGQKQQAEKLEREKQDALAEAQHQHETRIRNIFAVAFIIVLFLLGLLGRNLLRIRKSKQIITEQKVEVEKQKLIVDQKNKDITDSITYASRIQKALLTTETYIRKYVSDYFIMYKPRDIVSGDFYWAVNMKNKFWFACCDCTGHGVPGAFMSILNINLLNEAIVEKGIATPDAALNDVRHNIITALNPEGSDTESKDGMDCALCCIDMDNMEMLCAAANNPVWIFRAPSQPSPLGKEKHQEISPNGGDLEGAVVEILPDKMPVGIQFGEQKPFTLHRVKLNKGDTIYLFTDGYADQFGGEKGKKFKYKNMQELAAGIKDNSMKEQKEILEKTMKDWQGNLEQIDDMLVIGIKV